MNKAIFLDRDGTLVVDIGYVHKVEDFELQPGVEGLKKLKDFKLFIVSNQSGIGRGHFKEEEMHIYNNHLLEELKKQDIAIEKVYFCPHHPNEGCDCRKPSQKFVKDAEKEFSLDLSKSWVIGDMIFDVGLAKNCGCKSVSVLTGWGVKHLDEIRKLQPDYIAANIDQAADYILSKGEKIVSSDKLVGKKNTVMVSGSFDILHKGHEKILSEAKEQGDILIVGINSDSSVRKNKGNDRPINNENSRARMIANYADYVVIFDEDNPLKLIDKIKPNVFVNGSDYGEDCIENEAVKKYGGRIHIVKLLKGYSTTSIIGGK